MAGYTSQQRVEIIKIYYRKSQSVASTLRAQLRIFGRNNLPSRSKIKRLVEKFDYTGTVQHVAVPTCRWSARSIENIAAAEASVEESPNVSLTRRSQAALWRRCGESWPTSLTNWKKQIDERSGGLLCILIRIECAFERPNHSEYSYAKKCQTFQRKCPILSGNI